MQEVQAVLDVAKAGGNLINTVTEVFGAYWKPVAQARGEVKAEEIRERHRARKEQLREEGQFCMESRAELVRIEQSEREQQNIEAVVSQFVLRTEGHDNGTPPNNEWSDAFRRGARTASSDEMRTLWARILKAEYEKQGSIRKRTMAVIQEMDMADALLFERVVSVLIGGTYIYREEKKGQPFEYAGISYDEVLRLGEARLIASADSGAFRPQRIEGSNGTVVWGAYLTFGNGLTAFARRNDSKGIIPVLTLSDAGVELASVVETTVNWDGITACINLMMTSGFTVGVATREGSRWIVRADIDGPTTVDEMNKLFIELQH